MTKAKNTKPKKNMYFTKDHENAIIEYAKTDDIKIRTDLYINWIEPAFSEMVNKIIYTYRFTSLPNIDLLRDECKIWLTTILDKYDPNKGSKAFSYFSVITKNWFIHKVRKTSIESKREVHIDSIPKNIEISNFSVENEYYSTRETDEFWGNLWEEAIYLYIREITGLNTKQVVNNLNKMRQRYKTFKKKWDRGEI
jgi:DNA-directed RNA polymerase specialized sigma subunit